MNFTLSDEQLLMQEMFRDFAQNEVQPLAAELDEDERFPEETVAKMKEVGLLGIPIPEEYGGAGAGNMEYAMAVEELSRVCGSTGVIVSAHTSLCCWPICEYGTDRKSVV